MSKQAVRDYLVKYKSQIDGEIFAELGRRKQEVGEISPHLVPIIEAMEELAKGGKRLRGLLAILGYELAGGEVNHEIVKVAAGMEIFHLGLLIQDDWMDRDEKRRGVETIHVRYEDAHLGRAVATLAGDLAPAWVGEILSELDLDSDSKLRALSSWGKYFSRVVYGQTLDVMSEQRGEANEQEILQVLQLKSGEYTCVMPLVVGCKLATPTATQSGGQAGGSADLEDVLIKYGMELGWVFQLRDDYLSEWGEEEKTGKPVGNDRREGKKSFAIVYGKEKLLSEIGKHWEEGKKILCDLRGDSLKVVMEGLLEWMAEREN